MGNTLTLEIEALTPDQIVKKETLVYEEAKPAEQETLDEMLARLNILDAHSIISYGSNAQAQLTMVSEKVLASIESKDSGLASQALTEMTYVVREFDLQDLGSCAPTGFLSRLLGLRAKPVVKFISLYDDLNGDPILEDNTFGYYVGQSTRTLTTTSGSTTVLMERTLSTTPTFVFSITRAISGSMLLPSFPPSRPGGRGGLT